MVVHPLWIAESKNDVKNISTRQDAVTVAGLKSNGCANVQYDHFISGGNTC